MKNTKSTYLILIYKISGFEFESCCSHLKLLVFGENGSCRSSSFLQTYIFETSAIFLAPTTEIIQGILFICKKYTDSY